MESKRRLPILQARDDVASDPRRPGWQWIGFGAVAIFVLWLPLSTVAGLIASFLSRPAAREDGGAAVRGELAFAVTSAIALALSSLAAGLVVGKWGGPGVGVRQAALSAVLAVIVAVIASWISFGFAPEALLVMAIAVPAAALGGRAGRSAR